MTVQPGDTIIIGETRYVVLATSPAMIYTRREGAPPHDVTYMRRDTLEGNGVRIERKGEEP